MTDGRRVLAANTFYSGVGVYAEYTATFIVSIVVARRLGPDDYGTYTLLLWMVMVAVSLANNGLTTGVMKFVSEARGSAAMPASGVFRYCERLQLAAAAAVCIAAGVLLVAAPGAVARAAGAPPVVLWLLLPAVLGRSLYLFYFAGAKGFENFRAGARVHAAVAPASVLAVVVVADAAGTLAGFVSVYVVTALLSMAAMRRALRRGTEGRPAHPPRQLVRRIVRHVGYASAIVALDLIVLRQTEIVFLNRFATAADIGYFGLGRSLSASALLLVPGVLTALLVPVMARTFGEAPAMLGPRFIAATRYIVILVVPVVALCQVYAGDIVIALYGQDYAPAVLVFRVTVAASAIGVVSASASSYQLGADRQPAIVVMMTVVAMVTLMVDYLLIRSFGLPGAIAAGALGSLLLGVVLLWHARSSLAVRFQWAVYARAVAAGVVSTLPALAVRPVLPVWLAVPLGGMLLVLAYGTLSVLLRVWTRPDLEALSAMTDVLPPRFGVPASSFLEWAAHASAMDTSQ